MSDVSIGRQTADVTRPLEADKSLGELVGRLTGDLGDLISTHVELAKAEAKEEATRAARGVGLLAAAALAALMALILLSFAAAWGLAEALPEGFAFLIVGAVWLVITMVLVTSGRAAMKRLRGAPQTKASLKEDIAWAHRPTS